jgi:hypothetical protein
MYILVINKEGCNLLLTAKFIDRTGRYDVRWSKPCSERQMSHVFFHISMIDINKNTSIIIYKYKYIPSIFRKVGLLVETQEGIRNIETNWKLLNNTGQREKGEE